MRRNTLALFIRGAVLAALPLIASCGGPTDTAGGWVVDGGIGELGCTVRCARPGLPSTGFCDESKNSAGQPVTDCHADHTGRRPAGLMAARVDGGSAVGNYFARAAHLEAASVPAFRRLRAELRAHGAPRRLVDACTRAAHDEIRHARSATRLARRFGATRPPVRVTPAAPRSLMALALENAREGCVAESFGALVASWQAETAQDPDVRAHLQSIAADETEHAELAWAIDGWLRTRLRPGERAHLAAVRAEELARIAVGLAAPVDAELQRAAGLPPPAIARRLHRAFAVELARRA